MCTARFDGHHQMSVVGRGVPSGGEYPPPSLDISTPWIYPPPGHPHPRIHLRQSGHTQSPSWKGSGIRNTHPPPEQTHTCENITFPQLRWRVVTIIKQHYIDRPKNFLTVMAYLYWRTWTRIRVRISVPKMGTVPIRDLILS